MSKREVLALLLCALLVGCSPLAPRPDPSRFYVLSPLSDSEHNPTLAGLALGLGPIKLADYLRRPEIATRVGPNQLRFAEFARWAEPLDTSIGRVLASNLSVVLGTERIAVFPWFGSFQPTCVVELDVQQFEQTAEGTVRLVASWTVRESSGKAPLAVRQTNLSEPAAPGDVPAAVAALSRTLTTLGSEMAEAIRLAPRRRP